MAAPLLGFIMAIAGLAISIIYTEHVYKKEMTLVAAGKEEGWDKNWKSPVKGELKSRDELPGTVSSFLPLIFLVAFIVIGSLTKFYL